MMCSSDFFFQGFWLLSSDGRNGSNLKGGYKALGPILLERERAGDWVWGVFVEKNIETEGEGERGGRERGK